MPKTHGQRRTKEYNVWCHVKGRCLNPRNKKFVDYGGRGIKICKRWLNSFENFLADMGRAPKGTTLDRRNNEGNYTPSNCRWATHKTQQRNRRDTIYVVHDGEKRTLKEWAELTGISYHTLFARYSGRSRLSLFYIGRKVKGQ